MNVVNGDNNNAVRIDNDANNIAVGIESDDNMNEEKITVVLEGDDKERIVFLYTSGEDEEGSL